MAENSSNKKSVSLRITNVIHSDVSIYAKAHNLTFTKAVEELLEEGLKARNEPLATKSDIERLITETKRMQEQQEIAKLALVQAIQSQPVEIQKIEPPKRRWFDFFKGKD